MNRFITGVNKIAKQISMTGASNKSEMLRMETTLIFEWTKVIREHNIAPEVPISGAD